jgi:uncharacterized protein DUF1843
MENVIPPYGVAIHQAISAGDLRAMREVQARAEEYLRNADEVKPALESLRAEIARLESSSGG